MNKVLIIANCASGLYDFREDLIRRLDTLNQKVYASVPVDEYVEELTYLCQNCSSHSKIQEGCL